MCRKLSLLSTLVLLLALAGGQSRANTQDDFQKGIRGTNEWLIRFDPKMSVLELVHQASGAKIVGRLSFAVEHSGGLRPFLIVLPQDSLSTRLAMLDESGDIQGYLSFSGTGDRLTVSVVHRAEQNYSGRLTFRATAQLGKRSFACRTRPPAGSRIVQMASGAADSGLNDSLFDIAADTALRLTGHSVSIKTQRQADDKPTFDVEMTAVPHEPANSTLVFELIRNYYRSRYVPYYAPINKKRLPSAPTGWLSWNVYFDTCGEKGNLKEAGVAAKYLKPFGLEFWSVESWQKNSEKLPVSKFYNLTMERSLGKFPHEMKWLAEQLAELGFRPGIWTVPFGTGDKNFYETHKSWFLHDTEGKPMSNWSGLYVLDPSQEIVRKYMGQTIRTMSQEWGYEYFKIDGMSARNSHKSAHFYERPEVRAAFKQPCEEPFRLCVEALREGMGPDNILMAAGGHYSGQEVGFVDAARLGADIVHWSGKPPKWYNYLNQARMVLNQLFVHNIIWYNDPDTLLVGEASPLNTVRIATTVVALPGQLTFTGDKLSELPAERMRLLQQALPVCDVRPLDLFPIFDMLPVWDLKINRPFGSWDVVSLFNWDDRKPADIELRFEELGLPGDAEYLIYDFWNQVLLGRFSECFTASVSARSNQLLAVHPLLGRPQFLSTDRHITQGGVSFEDMTWDDKNNILSGSVRLVENFPSKLVFFIPEEFELLSVKAEDEVEVITKTNYDRTVAVTLQRATSGLTEWKMKFLRLN